MSACHVNNAPITDHNALDNLATGDVHTQYFKNLGRAGGQSGYGGTGSGDHLALFSTFHATKGHIQLWDTAWLNSALLVNNAISPGSIPSDQNDYTPTGGSRSPIWRLICDIPVNITGISTDSANVNGFLLFLINVDTADNITLKDESASSTASNRMSLGGADIEMVPGDVVLLIYDGTSSRWRLLACQPRRATAAQMKAASANNVYVTPYRMRHHPGVAKAGVTFNGTTNNNLAGTYSRASGTITVTATAHGMVTGNLVNLDFTSGTATDGIFEISVTDANTFTVTQAGTSTSGNVTILRNTVRTEFGVNSVVDCGTGDYAVNFDVPFNSIDYFWTGGIGRGATSGASRELGLPATAAPSTTYFRLSAGNSAGSAADSEYVSLLFFGELASYLD